MRFSIIIRADHTNRVYFRDTIDSIVSQDFSDFELLIVDGNPDASLGTIVREFFPSDDRIIYRHIVDGRTAGFMLNYAVSTSHGDILLFINQHDRLSNDTLSVFLKEIIAHPDKKVFYSDYDEIENSERVRPHFLSAYNVELLRQTNYIGTSFAIRRGGSYFNTNLKYFPEYEYLLHFTERRNTVHHIPKLLFHKHVMTQDDCNDYFSMYEDFSPSKLKQEKEKLIYRRLSEAKTIVASELTRRRVHAEVETNQKFTDKTNIFSVPVISVNYDGSNYIYKKASYLFIKDKSVRLLGRQALKRLYASLSQPDVVMVGGRMLKDIFTIDSCGYIYDNDGIAYPACHDEGTLNKGYDGRIQLRQDVSAVSLSCCIVDAKFFKKAGGLNKRMARRDMMLDLSLKAIEHGFRIVYEPTVLAIKGSFDNESSSASNELLLERHGDFISNGDYYYNENLPIGIKNYSLKIY